MGTPLARVCYALPLGFEPAAREMVAIEDVCNAQAIGSNPGGSASQTPASKLLAARSLPRTFAALVLGLISFNQRTVFHPSFGRGKD